jgi:hypothetical protein
MFINTVLRTSNLGLFGHVNKSYAQYVVLQQYLVHFSTKAEGTYEGLKTANVFSLHRCDVYAAMS